MGNLKEIVDSISANCEMFSFFYFTYFAYVK